MLHKLHIYGGQHDRVFEGYKKFYSYGAYDSKLICNGEYMKNGKWDPLGVV